MDHWNTKQLPLDTVQAATIGPLSLYLKRVDEEILLATQQSDDLLAMTSRPLGPADEPVPENLDWLRFVSRREPCEVQMAPVMPNRPVVTRPAGSVRLPAGEAAVFYVTIPVWVRLDVHHTKPVEITEVPTVVLSNTWFGDPMVGDLCYALRTQARRDLSELQPWPHRVVCPFHVTNRAPEALDIERICVHVAFLEIFADDAGRLWSQRVNVDFRGRDRISDLSYGSGPPDAARNAKRLSAAREQYDGGGLLRRSLISVQEVFQR